MQYNVLIFLCLIVCTRVNADRIIFQEQDRIWHTTDFLHLAIDVDFQPIVSECKALKFVLNQPDSSKRDSTTLPHRLVDMNATRAYANQACAITSIWKADHVIEKRQLALLAIAAQGVFDIFAGVKIHHIQTRVDSIDKKLTRGLVILHKQETRVAAIESDFNQLNAKIIYENLNVVSLLEQLRLNDLILLHINLLSGHTAAVARAWAALVEGRLSLDLLAPDQWLSVVQRIKQEAAAMGAQLPVSSPLDMIQFPASFVARGSKWFVVVHFPLIHEEIKLYRHLPTPMYIDSQANDSARVVTLHAKSDLLLLTPDDLLHQETSAEALAARCYKVGGRAMCQNLGVFYKHAAATCLGSLFARDAASALRRCSMQLVQDDLSVTQLNPQTLIVFSRRGRGADIICADGNRTRLHVAGLSEVLLGQGCRFSTGDHLVRRSEEHAVRVHVIDQPLWDQGALEEAWVESAMGARNRTQEALNQAQRFEHALSRSDPADLEWLDRVTDVRTPDGRTLIRGLVACTGALAVVCALLIAFILWRLGAARTRGGAKTEGAGAGAEAEDHV